MQFVKYHCPICNQSFSRTRGARLREHYYKHHPEAHPYDLEYHMLTSKNPHLNVDLLLTRYLDREETVIGLQKQGIFAKHFLQNIGVARYHNEDKQIQGRQKWSAFSVERKFESFVKGEMSRLRNRGIQEELCEIVASLMTIKFAKKQLERARNPEEKPYKEQLIGEFTFIEADGSVRCRYKGEPPQERTEPRLHPASHL